MGNRITGKLRELTAGDGIKDGIPIAAGYFPIAMAFGILSKSTGLSFAETLAFSFVVFAGAAQFIAVGMIGLGASGLEIVMTTLFLNFRHFLMSASLARRISFSSGIWKPLISFFVTDESFSVASFADGELTVAYMLPMQLTGYLGWGIGTGVGYIAGSVLPPLLQQSMGIGLYALFVALLVPELRKSRRAILLAALAGAANTLLLELTGMPQGWSIVLAVILISAFGTMLPDSTSGEKGKDS